MFCRYRTELLMRYIVASRRLFFASVALAAFVLSAPVQSETLPEALALAYANNAELNSARAGTRAVDERVPQALSGYRPRIDAFATTGLRHTNPGSNTTRQAGIGVTLSQPIFRGFRTENGVKAAESAVLASRERLRAVEQNVLYDAVIGYTDVVQARAILDLRRSNVRFLSEQARAAGDRLQVGEGTRTDVSQAEAALAAATAAVSLAQANLASAEAFYERVTGRRPGALAAPRSADKLLPASLDAAIGASRREHPAILSAIHNSDVASFNVSVIEGELLPSVSVEATVRQDWENGSSGSAASVIGRVAIPIYEGGQTYSRVRQAKEELGQARIDVDVARDQVQASLVAAWSGLQAARAQTVAVRAEINALELALEGIVEEQSVGQRTTLDVLDAQSNVINARITQVQAERDVVVASYAILSATGQLSRERLGLGVAAYEPKHHYEQVRDKWIGLRTPDGR
jgi:outer membrane protein